MPAATVKPKVTIAPTGVVTVHVSAATLYNLGELQKLLPRVLGPLGCPGCHSGRPIIFQQQEEQFEIG